MAYVTEKWGDVPLYGSSGASYSASSSARDRRGSERSAAFSRRDDDDDDDVDDDDDDIDIDDTPPPLLTIVKLRLPPLPRASPAAAAAAAADCPRRPPTSALAGRAPSKDDEVGVGEEEDGRTSSRACRDSVGWGVPCLLRRWPALFAFVVVVVIDNISRWGNNRRAGGGSGWRISLYYRIY